MYYFSRLQQIAISIYEVCIIHILIIMTILKKKIRNKNFFFVQIGANDGKTGDPIYYLINLFNLEGILYEPVPYIFEELENNYKNNKKIILENKAVSSLKSDLYFYYLDKSGIKNMPKYYNQLGSFDFSVLMKNKKYIPNFNKLLRKTKVITTDFNNIIKDYNLENIDFIFIDTEGYDYEVLKLIPFEKINPSIIIFEHVHLSQSDLNSSLRLLESKNYKKIKNKGDFIFFK